MPRGGARPGTGGAQPGAGRPQRRPLVEQSDRPRFKTAEEFAIWALNAPDLEVGMDQKVRVMLGLLAATKQPAGKASDKPAEDPATGAYAPRKVRGFGVVVGSRQ